MRIKSLIQKYRCECKNIQWSWSYINHQEKLVLIGVWEHDSNIELMPVLLYDWKLTRKQKRRNSGYGETIKHLEHIFFDNYTIKCFTKVSKNPNQMPIKISTVYDNLFDVILYRKENGFFVQKSTQFTNLVEPSDFKQYNKEFFEGRIKYFEGRARERDSNAREECLKYHGYSCKVCGFNFEKKYGVLGKNYIHVHHITPLSKRSGEHTLDPTRDLIPICPNCHAMIHKKIDCLSIEELKNQLIF